MSSNRTPVSTLLPKSSRQFAKQEYWNKFFGSRKDSFEWYAESDHLKHVFTKYLKQNDSLLVIGCGNSSLSADLYDMGYKNNISVDISEVVVRQMNQKYNSKGERKGLEFRRMDVFDLNFGDTQFNVVIDKGTLDAIASDDQSVDAQKIFWQIDSVLKPFGRYVCVSLLQSHVLHKLIDWFSQNGNWFIRIERIESAEDMTRLESDNTSVILPVFCLIFTKLMPSKDPNPKPMIELSFDQINGKPKRLDTIEELFERIQSIQEFAFIQHYIKNTKISDDEDIHLDLYAQNDSSSPRYTLYFSNYANKRSKLSSSCGVFIVPEGREVEWLFSTSKGRIELTKQSGFERLIVVHLNREHNFSSIEQIKTELSPKILELLPTSIVQMGSEIPFLTLGDEVGTRKVVFEGKSDLSGDYVIEEVSSDGQTYRRLVFLQNKNIIQSEIKLKTIRRGKKKVLTTDSNYLSCSHHEIITAGLSLLQNQSNKHYDLLLIGLGGGCLASYLINNVKSDVQLNLKVVEIDSSMKEVALKWFDLKTSNESKNAKLDIEIEDGLKYIREIDARNQSFDAIIFDIDSKELSEGLSCPPKPFLETELIEKVKSLLVERKGVFVLNLVSRNEDIKKVIYDRLIALFESTLLYPIKQELNEILFSFSANESLPEWMSQKSLANKLKLISNHQFYMDSLKECYIDLCSNRLRTLK